MNIKEYVVNQISEVYNDSKLSDVEKSQIESHINALLENLEYIQNLQNNVLKDSEKTGELIGLITDYMSEKDG